jgi:hypothetical protein
MSSKRVRFTKGTKMAPNPNSKIAPYQCVTGFTRVPVAPDGNCFYTASGFFCGLTAPEMRSLLMKYFLFKKAEYAIFFETEKAFLVAVRENTLPRVWNSDLCDIVPHATAQLLHRDIIIHNSVDNKVVEVNIPFDGMGHRPPPIHLFRRNDHYEILLENSKKPNKNVWPLPDVSEFEEVIDLTFSDSDSDSEGGYTSEEMCDE